MNKVFISYDYDRDKIYKNMLLAWSRNDHFKRFSFEDGSTDISVKSKDIISIKRAISRRMAQCDIFLLLVGKKTSKSKWCSWEIEKAKELRLKLIVVKLDRSNKTPTGIFGTGASWALSFSLDSIKKAMR